jgi:hypothetical protein
MLDFDLAAIRDDRGMAKVGCCATESAEGIMVFWSHGLVSLRIHCNVAARCE